MGTSSSTYRPWLAAVLSLVVTGLGHAYLRQWLRAVAWFVLAVAMGYLYLPTGALSSPFDVTFSEVAPVAVIALLASVDAYLQARRHNFEVGVTGAERCPHCGRQLDADLTFCHWCTEPVRDPGSEANRGTSSGD